MAIASEGSLEMRFAKARRRSISANDHLISPDQQDNGGGENSRSIPTTTHTIRQVYAHPLCDFSQAIADSDVSSTTTSAYPSACDLSEVVQSVWSWMPSCAPIVSFEDWHSLVSSANGGY